MANPCHTGDLKAILLSILPFSYCFYVNYKQQMSVWEFFVPYCFSCLFHSLIPWSFTNSRHQLSAVAPGGCAPLRWPQRPGSRRRAALSRRISPAGRWRMASRVRRSPRRARGCDCRVHIPLARAGSSWSGASSCGNETLPGKRRRSPRARPPARGAQGWRRTAGRDSGAPRRCRWCGRHNSGAAGAPAPTVQRPQRWFWFPFGPSVIVLSGLSAVTPGRACGLPAPRRKHMREELNQGNNTPPTCSH